MMTVYILVVFTALGAGSKWKSSLSENPNLSSHSGTVTGVQTARFAGL